MALALRIENSGAFYHVINNGNRREDIFNGSDHASSLMDWQIAVKPTTV